MGLLPASVHPPLGMRQFDDFLGPLFSLATLWPDLLLAVPSRWTCPIPSSPFFFFCCTTSRRNQTRNLNTALSSPHCQPVTFIQIVAVSTLLASEMNRISVWKKNFKFVQLTEERPRVGSGHSKYHRQWRPSSANRRRNGGRVTRIFTGRATEQVP